MGIILESYLNESNDKSIFNKKYKNNKYLDLNQFKKVNCFDKKLSKYYKQCKDIKDLHDGTFGIDIKKGYVYIDKNNGELVGYVFVNTTRTICPIYIYPKYRGYNLSSQMLNVAINELGANRLICYDDNEIAKELYLKHGFKINKTKVSGKETWHEMILK